MLFLFAKTFSFAIRAFGDSFVVRVYIRKKMIPFGLDLGFAVRADVRSRYHAKVSYYQDYHYGNSNKIPRYVIGSVEPIYSASG